MLRTPPSLAAGLLLCALAAFSQTDTAPAKPTEHLLGTITALNLAAHQATIKDDKSGAESIVILQDTRTLLRVMPGAKDLKSATRITAGDLQIGDRVDIRGFKSSADASQIAARSVVLMSARDLQQAHQAQAAEWQQSTPGRVISVDPGSGTIVARVRGSQGSQQVTIQSSPTTDFTRYSPDNQSAPARSQLLDIHPGDQVRVIGQKNADGSAIQAQKIYSGAFRTVNGTILSIAPDAKLLTVKSLASGAPVPVLLTNAPSVKKLPPALAAMLARQNAHPASRDHSSAAEGPGAGGSHDSGPPPVRSGGDVSQMVEQLPSISLSDLKPGDAVVISAVADAADDHKFTATHIIAGVEPLFQSAPARQRGESGGGDWGLGEISAPE